MWLPDGCPCSPKVLPAAPARTADGDGGELCSGRSTYERSVEPARTRGARGLACRYAKVRDASCLTPILRHMNFFPSLLPGSLHDLLKVFGAPLECSAVNYFLKILIFISHKLYITLHAHELASVPYYTQHTNAMYCFSSHIFTASRGTAITRMSPVVIYC